MTVVRTYSGKNVDLINPGIGSIDIRDIAHHLALTNRFGGASTLPYSVAQHSVYVVKHLASRKATPQVQLRGLLHDGHEAYLGDFTRPVKWIIRPVKWIIDDWSSDAAPISYLCDRLDAAIFARFGVTDAPMLKDDPVAWADDALLAAEWRDLMRGPCPTDTPPAPFAIRPVPWAKAEEDFLECFARLSIHVGSFNPVPSGIFK